jgi:hypothetical protein
VVKRIWKTIRRRGYKGKKKLIGSTNVKLRFSGWHPPSVRVSVVGQSNAKLRPSCDEMAAHTQGRCRKRCVDVDGDPWRCLLCGQASYVTSCDAAHSQQNHVPTTWRQHQPLEHVDSTEASWLGTYLLDRLSQHDLPRSCAQLIANLYVRCRARPPQLRRTLLAHAPCLRWVKTRLLKESVVRTNLPPTFRPSLDRPF